MRELFDEYSHLTDYALDSLINDKLDDLSRLEVAEHMSFCDDCLKRYLGLLDKSELLCPPEMTEKRILSKLKNQPKKSDLRNYFSMAIAACFALVFWVTGVFTIPSSNNFREDERKSIMEVSYEFRGDMLKHINKILNSIQLKGVNFNEK